jgi:hypothetical protein
MLDFAMQLASGGLKALEENLVGKLSGAFIPAFFVAGGVGVFVPKSVVVEYLSPQANRFTAYFVASIAGAVLSVCSCGIIPLFAAFYEQGAGLGPAVTFLFAGPSINLISMFYGFYLLGPRMGSCVIGTVLVTSVCLGLTFEWLFGRNRPPAPPPPQPLLGAKARGFWPLFFFFLFLLLMTLLLPIERFGWDVKLSWAGGNLVGLLVTLRRHFSRADIRAWVDKSLFLVKRLLPRILLGIFLLGMLQTAQERSPESFDWFRRVVGQPSPVAALLASTVGAILYMGSILAVLTVKALMHLGMASGPAVAFVAAAPGVSFSTLFAVAEVLGMRLSLAYYGMVILFAAAAGWAVGALGLV